MIVRPAEANDCPAILEIMNHAIEHTTAIYDYSPRNIQFVKDWLVQKQQQQHPVLIAATGGRVQGYATYGTFRNWDAYKYSVEHSVYVHPDHQKLGIGKTLLLALAGYAKDAGFHTMIGGIDATNDASISLHANLGFTHAGTLRQVGYKFNRWLDLVFMQLMLSTPN